MGKYQENWKIGNMESFKNMKLKIWKMWKKIIKTRGEIL